MSSVTTEARGSRRFIRRIDIRLTVWFSLVLLLTSLTIFGLTAWNLHRTLVNEDRQELQNRVLGFWARFQAAESEEVGLNRLVNAIETDTMGLGDRPYFVRIATADNTDVYVRIPLVEWQFAFDLTSLFEGSSPHASGFLTVPSDTLGYDMEVIGYPLSEAYVLQIGMDTATREQVLRLFRTSFLFVFAILFGVSVLGGLLFTNRSLRPIGSLNATIKQIIETGEFSQRIPRSGAGDDLDDLIVSFNHMLDRVKQLVQGMRDALDAVAHDLRTPMTRFRATAESALSAPDQMEMYKDALGAALEESDHMLRMLNSMMDISEANAGAMSLKLEEIDFSRLVAEVAEVYSVVAEEAELGIDLALEDITVTADAGRLQQVVGNLVDNAVKYARSGSRITIALVRDETPGGLPDLAAGMHPSAARLSVRNEGRGIAQEEIPHIWTRLYRGSDGKRSAGLGLGLTLVRAIVEAHGGTVDVTSEYGSFAEFSIFLPLSEKHK